uniref:non-specific serine/threonine protein kinase n=1 Tax=Ciona savignyi TaxID=51511 RepID=H2ZHE6_CIOSA
MQVEVNGVKHDIALHGIQTHIIDFTLSRMTKGKVSLFQDLSNDPDLFKGDSSIDYQFEIYRMIKKELSNDWSQFKPKTNIFWIHYLLDKFIFHVSYKYKRSKLHSNSLKLLKTLHRTVLNYDSCLNFYTSSSLFKNE